MTRKEELEKLKEDEHYYGKFGKQFLSNSDISTLLTNPLALGDQQKQIPAFLVGGYFHTAILEPEKLKKFRIVEASTRNTKAYKEISGGEMCLLQSEVDKLEVMIDTMMSNEVCRDLIQDGVVELVSRQGEVSYLKGTTFLDELSTLDDCVLNGELTIDGVTRTIANGMVNSMMDIIEKADERGAEKTAKKKEAFVEKHGDFDKALENMRFTVWDMITNKEYTEAKSDTPYKDRLKHVEMSITKLTMVSGVETRFISTFEEAIEHFLETQERGLEGTIIKSSNAGWKDGKPTYQIKMKLEMNMDFRIIGFKYGNEGTKNEHVISTLMVESSCGTLKTNPSGMKEAMMKDVTERQEDLLGTVVEMRCCGLSQNNKGEWSTMHPSVVELRSDKDTCDSLETALEIQEMAKTLAS